MAMRGIATALLLITASALQAAPVDRANPKRGEKLYQTACAACHGPDGRGTVPGVPDFTKRGNMSPGRSMRSSSGISSG